MFIRHTSNTLKAFISHVFYYPTPVNFNYLWNFGFISLSFLLIQILSGIFLAMHYIPDINLAFYSVEHIMRDVNYGWLIRYAHSNGASFFFIAVYLHMARGLYYRSFSYENMVLWFSGVIIFLLMIVTAFLGYVLPWGQMSYWAATVITNLVSVLPYIGVTIVEWLWGGFSVGAPTLSRFFSIHYLLPFIILFLVFIHFILLHEKGSTNPYFISVNINRGYTYLYPYFIIKDVFGLLLFFIPYVVLICYAPNLLGHSDNYIQANPMVTPEHIVPEWYFLPFYAILRSFTNKIVGVAAMLLSILIILVLPLLHKITTFAVAYNKDNGLFLSLFNYYIYPIFVNIFFSTFLLLGWLGAMPATKPFTEYGIKLTYTYFFLIIFLGIFDFFKYILIYMYYNFFKLNS